MVLPGIWVPVWRREICCDDCTGCETSSSRFGYSTYWMDLSMKRLQRFADNRSFHMILIRILLNGTGRFQSRRLRKYHFPDKDDFRKLSPDEQLAVCRWDDVNAMYRRDILIILPFRETDFAEDVLWAKDALMAGHAIVYNPVSQVEHYHQEDYQFAFKRNFIVQYHFYKYFGVLPVRSKKSFVF